MRRLRSWTASSTSTPRSDPFFADLPLVFELAGIVRGIFTIQRVNGNDGDLRVRRGVIELGADLVEARDRCRRQHVGEITDIIGGLGQVLYPFGGENRGRNN